jgi:hypothetical protein
MRMRFWSLLAVPAVAVAAAGCGGGSTGTQGPAGAAGTGQGVTHSGEKSGDEATIRANVAKLGPEDRKLAEEQGYCAVELKNPLGSMGAPHKVMVRGQAVFLCCDGCETKAKAHADRTLARVQQLREKRAGKPAE